MEGTDSYAPYTYRGKTMLIERYLLLGRHPCGEEGYDPFRLLPGYGADALNLEEIDPGAYPLFDDLDRERFNSFRYREDCWGKAVTLYTRIYSKTRTQILLSVSCCRGKLWLNGRCLSVHWDRSPSEYMLTAALNRGVNHLLLELLPLRGSNRFSVQIMNRRSEMSGGFLTLSRTLHSTFDPLILVHDPFVLPKEETFRFMYIKNDGELLRDYQVEIVDSIRGLVKTLPARLGEMVAVDLRELRRLHEDPLRHEWLRCVFQNKKGERLELGPCILIGEFSTRSEEIRRRLEERLPELPPEAYAYCRAEIERQKGAGDADTMRYWYTHRSLEAAAWLEKGIFPYGYYRTPGVWEWFIHSELDDSIVRLGILIPPGYDEHKAYPAVIALSTGNEGYVGWELQQLDLGEPCFCFDVTGRGVTGGSYVGEASTLEILRWILTNFRVDEDRLYVLGGSNGGFASYALAQNHPSLPAALYPFIGYPQMETLENLSNIPTYQIVSPEDYVFAGRENAVRDRLRPYGNYHQYDMRQMAHHHLYPYLYHQEILRALLRHRRNRYPERLRFKTFRNRHCESYWIRLHGIEKGRRCARLRAEIPDAGSIRLTVYGATGITVTLPPQIDRENFAVFLNRQRFSFSSYTGGPLVFVRNGGWKRADAPTAADLRKGTGLLDVYLDSLRIVIPDGADEELRELAGRFAHPSSNGFDSRIYVDYPVYPASRVPRHLFAHNLILVDRCGENPLVERFRDKLAVDYDQEGYTYQGMRRQGDYVLLQVLPNPYDARRSMLVVGYNSSTLLKRHLLLRRIILPTYVNGIDPYWNNEVLVYTGRYWAAYEEGAPLEPVEGTTLQP